MSPARLRLARIAAVVLVVALIAIAHRLGVLDDFADPAHLEQTLIALGPWGYAAFVLAYTLLQPFGVPGTVFVMAAPLIWPWPVAFALSMTGTMTASVVGFVFARFVARDWATAMIPPRFRKVDDALARHGFRTVFVLRFVFWMPPWLHALFGVSKVGFGTHFRASLAGYALPLLAVSYFGQALFDWLRALPASTWMAVAAVTLGVGVGAWLVWRGRATTGA